MMKRILILLPALLLLTSLAYARSYERPMQAGDYKITMETGDPLLKVRGNPVSIRISDSQGAAVTDAQVEVSYFMRARPTMITTVKAEYKGTSYKAVITPSMIGKLQVKVKIEDRNGRESEASLQYEVIKRRRRWERRAY